ncbi:MAG: hypothetical protein FJY11_02500 [Bacteroidetes bacterium]|nr:hypothetical protein [Bacteroidota bacterium]
MKKIFALLIAALMFVSVLAQEETDYPVRDVFETGILMDNPTVLTPFKGLLEFQIHHRFGIVNNGIKDVFGIYAPSNIRLGLNYGITDRIMIGAGSTKDYKLQDFIIKYAILQQTVSGKVPVSLTYYGNMVVDLRNESEFGPAEAYREIHRLSYFNQVIVARKISEVFSLQVAPTFFYFNSVQTGYRNANFALSVGGRARFAASHAIIAEYNQVLNGQKNEDFNPKPQLAIGWEKGTATHAFQLFFANYKGIVPQRNFLFNQNDFASGDYLVGMNITVKF